MYLSDKERDRRYDQLRKVMAKEDIRALLVVGNNCRGGTTGTGSFRYLTDYFMIFYYGLLLFFQDEAPILLVGSELQHVWAKRYSWIHNIRVSSDLAESAAEILLGKGLEQGKIGVVGMESISAAAYFSIAGRLPQATFFDGSPLLFDLRLRKGEAERELLDKAAVINDEAYLEVLKQIRPGIREYEIVGILEGYHRGSGADQTFNLISSGPFPTSAEGETFLGQVWYPGDREIREGDCVLLEMTTAYGGYWNQLVRMVSVVSVKKENPELLRFHKAAFSAIQAGLEKWTKGTKTADFVRSVAAVVEEEGFNAGFPMGHFIGLDLMEARLSTDSPVVLDPGIVAVIHPSVMNTQGIRLFLGQTYFIADDGPVRLNQADDTLRIV